MSEHNLTENQMKEEIKILKEENKEFEKILMNTYPKDGWKNTVNIIAKELNLKKEEIDILLESDDEK